MDIKTITKEIVAKLIQNEELFTALDVSNKVKEKIPFAQHRFVRDEIKELWRSDIEPASYGRTTIEVTLQDGSKTEAFLYHPLSDTWDLESKYTNRSAVKTPNPQINAFPAFKDDHTNTVKVVSPKADDDKSSMWGNLFSKNQPSLFPSK